MIRTSLGRFCAIVTCTSIVPARPMASPCIARKVNREPLCSTSPKRIR
jgi:hypothetical protein